MTFNLGIIWGLSEGFKALTEQVALPLLKLQFIANCLPSILQIMFLDF